MDGIHLELEYAFTANYGTNIIIGNATNSTNATTI
jgi:hypothetical protein